MKSCHCDNTDGPWDAKGNKSYRLRNIKYDLTFMWNLKNKIKPIDTGNRLVIARGKGRGWNAWRESDLQTSSDKINKSWGHNVKCGDYS